MIFKLLNIKFQASTFGLESRSDHTLKLHGNDTLIHPISLTDLSKGIELLRVRKSTLRSFVNNAALQQIGG